MRQTRNQTGATTGIATVALGALLLAGGQAQAGTRARVTHTSGQSVTEALAEPYDGPRARIAVGDFEYKAARGDALIGDALREMLVTALFDSDEFIVLERQAIQDVMLEQDFGVSGRVRRGTAAPIGEIEGAEILVYGTVSEFKAKKSGGGLRMAFKNVPLRFGMNNAHLAIDLRAVDTTTGRVLLSTRVEGKAKDFSGSLAASVGGGGSRTPVSLGGYQGTPMEKAMRVVIDRAVDYLASQMPSQYFHASQ